MNLTFPWPQAIPNAFAFVLNPFHYTGLVPIELIPGAELDRANTSQVKIIENIRDRLGRAGKSMAFLHEPILDEVRESAEWNRILPPRTTFWAINFDIHPSVILKFRQASQLTDNELEIGAIFPPEEQRFLPRVEFSWSMESYFDRSWRNDAQPLNLEALTTTRYAHGEKPDFDKPSRERGFKELDGLYEVYRFVRESLKRLLILALEEPQLVFDLKAC